MSNSVYSINKGINRPIEFKGLKAQYIGWLGAGLLILLVLFYILYICGVNTFLCLAIIISGGIALFLNVYKISRKYGQHGMMKLTASRLIPPIIKSYSRLPFIALGKQQTISE